MKPMKPILLCAFGLPEAEPKHPTIASLRTHAPFAEDAASVGLKALD